MEDVSFEVRELLTSLIKRIEYLKEKETIRTKNEIIPDFSALNLRSVEEYIETEVFELGKVLNFTEGYIVATKSAKAPLLELDTKVCDENRLIIGVIDDIIGSVECPHYSILAYKRVEVDTQLFYPWNSQILAAISKKKGTDASNNNDEETSEESSDDEAHKQPINKKRGRSFKILETPPPFE